MARMTAREEAHIIADANEQADHDVVRDVVLTALRRALGGLLDTYPSEGMRRGVSSAVGEIMGEWLLQAPEAGPARHAEDRTVELLVWVEGLLQGLRETMATAVYGAMHGGGPRAHGSTAEAPSLRPPPRRFRRTTHG